MSNDKSHSGSHSWKGFSSEQITLADSGTAIKSLTTAKFSATTSGQPNPQVMRAVIECRTNPCLFTTDGTSPNTGTGVGMKLSAGDYLYITGFNDISKFKAANFTAGSNALLSVIYEAHI